MTTFIVTIQNTTTMQAELATDDADTALELIEEEGFDGSVVLDVRQSTTVSRPK